MRASLLAGFSASVLALVAVATSPVRAADARDPKVELGRRLFFDPAIGRQGRVACAACHDPEHGFSDARVASVDESGPLPRHSQPLTDLAGRGFHWDGEFDTVREIVEARVLPRDAVAVRSLTRAVERADRANREGATWDRERLRRPTTYGGMPMLEGDSNSPIENRLAASGLYARGFADAFGTPDAKAERVVDAVEAYVRSLRTSRNAYDRFAAGESGALEEKADRGRVLFFGKAGCVACHDATPRDGRALFTDGKFHDTGVAVALGEIADRGAGATTLRPADDGKFKTPSLRDVASRAPYMHDGRFRTLEEVVRYYDKGGVAHDRLDPLLHPLGLADGDVADLVAFLRSLTGAARAGLGETWGDRPTKLRVRVLGLRPGRRAEVRVTPCGDRLRDADAMPAPFSRTTDESGVVDVSWPASTHATISLPGLDHAPAEFVPDFVDSIDVWAIDPERPSVAIPADVCIGLDSIQVVPAAPSETSRAATLSRRERTPGGRVIFESDVPLERLRGAYELRRPSDGRVVGTYEPWTWRLRTDFLRSLVPARVGPQTILPAEVLSRMRSLLADR